jgi:hypothetical protein
MCGALPRGNRFGKLACRKRARRVLADANSELAIVALNDQSSVLR